jgi:hypothetical protein
LQYGECPEESIKIAGKRDVLRVSSWSELIQVLVFFSHWLVKCTFMFSLTICFSCYSVEFLKAVPGERLSEACAG